MGDKKTDRRFTIQFSRTDPAHLEAASILNQYERFDKARYIANAILHYEKCDQRDSLRSAKIDEKQIEAVVSRVLRESHSSGTEAAQDSDNKREGHHKHFDEITFDDAMESLGEDGLNAVSDALEMFRRK
ncbi:MAG: hypothetical protein FWE20_12675 [Defluviitaleaceae bacterium]|nr:hypothetical protein [Defluviitaleaceae bacterium]